MKTKFLNQAKWLMAIVAMFTLSVPTWGAVDDVHALIDFSLTGNLGHSSYTDNWTIAANTNSSGNLACKVHYATSNNVAYICFGGKPTGADSYLGTTAATTYPTKKFSINVGKLSNKGHLTINSVKLYVYGTYSADTYSNKIDEITFTDDYAVGVVDVTPTSGVWPTGSYFLLVLNLTNTNTSENDYTSITYMKVTEGSPNYTLTYNANGKDGGGAAPTDANSPYAPSSTVTVLGNTNSMTRTGCTFGGWNTAADGGGTSYTAGNTFTISANTTLYAKWLATVTWVVDGTTVRTDANLVIPAAGKSVTPPSAPSPASNCGDKFMGWTTTNIGASGIDKSNTSAISALNLFTGAKVVTGDATFYAVFADYAE